MDDLLQIVAMCKCEVALTINDHFCNYQSAKEWLDCPSWDSSMKAEIPNDVKAEIAARNTVVHLQFFPDTPIGSYSIYHYDIAVALSEGVQFLKKLREEKS